MGWVENPVWDPARSPSSWPPTTWRIGLAVMGQGATSSSAISSPQPGDYIAPVSTRRARRVQRRAVPGLADRQDWRMDDAERRRSTHPRMWVARDRRSRGGDIARHRSAQCSNEFINTAARRWSRRPRRFPCPSSAGRHIHMNPRRGAGPSIREPAKDRSFHLRNDRVIRGRPSWESITTALARWLRRRSSSRLTQTTRPLPRRLFGAAEETQDTLEGTGWHSCAARLPE